MMLYTGVDIADRYVTQPPVDPWQAGLILVLFAVCTVTTGWFMRRFVEGVHASRRWNVIYGALSILLILLGPIGTAVAVALWINAYRRQ